MPGFVPEIPATTNTAYVSAWRKGRQAAIDGLTLDANPYRGSTRFGNRSTFGLTFRKYWRDGFESVTLFPKPEDEPKK